MKTLLQFSLLLALAGSTLAQGPVKGTTGSFSGHVIQVPVATIAALKAVSVVNLATNTQIYVRGYYADNDGGEGSLIYDVASVAADNGGTIIAPNAGSGRWLRPAEKPMNVRRFGAVGNGAADDTAEIQAAITATGGSIYVPGGTYKITSTLLFNTVGLGDTNGLSITGDGSFKSIIDNRTGTNAIHVTGGADLGFQYRGVLADFAITNTTAVASTSGILLQGSFQGELRGLRIVQQASHGVRVNSTDLDLTDCAEISVRGCDLSSNGGWGMLVSADANCSNVNIVLDQCRVIANTSGGVSFESVIQGVVQNSAIAYNLGVGFSASRQIGGVYSKVISVINNEFDSNTGTQALLDYAVATTLSLNTFICNTGVGVPVVTKNVSVTGNCMTVDARQNSPRIPVGYAGVTMFDIAAGASSVRITNTDWSGWESAGNTKYTDAGTQTTIVDINAHETKMIAKAGLIGGTTTTSDLILQTTSGVGATGADMRFLVGNNGATEAFTILNSGNVGIGTTSPGDYLARKLVVAAGSNDGITIASGVNDNGALYFADGTTGDERYRGGLVYIHALDRLDLYASGAVKATIASTGNLLVGTTTDDGANKLQVAGSGAFSGGIAGTTAGGNATAGHIGEYVSASVVQGSAEALTTATPNTIASISLTAGDWDITGIGAITGASTGTVFDVAVGTTTDSFTGTVLGDTRLQTPTVSLAGSDASLMVPAVRVSIAATTIYYLVVSESFTIGTPAAYGRISARRVR